MYGWDEGEGRISVALVVEDSLGIVRGCRLLVDDVDGDDDDDWDALTP